MGQPDDRRWIQSSEGSLRDLRVVAIALNTSLIADEAEARRVIEETARETGLPAADPVRFGADGLWAAIHAALEPVGSPA